jgi:thiol-disulfide isomerase/thioredoxin
MRVLLLAAYTISVVVLPVVAQTSEQAPDPIALLQQVAKNYAAKGDTFHIESIEESTRKNDYSNDWEKTVRTAIKGPGNLYRIEARSGYGSAIRLSDGANEWIYLVEARLYVKRPVPAQSPSWSEVSAGEMEIYNAWQMLSFLESEAASYMRATLLPEETIQVEGKSFSCYLVHVTSKDTKRHRDDEFSSETTYWIDKTAMVFRKRVEKSHSYMISGRAHIPFDGMSTTVYPAVEFNSKPDLALFHFSPPADSTQVASLNMNMPLPPKASSQMVGGHAPDVQFQAVDGSSVSLKSYEGKPVLIDFWATWCGPCLLAMPSFAKLYAEVKDKGLTVLSVDQDRARDDAVSYLERHNYRWTNYHDEDDKIGGAFKVDGIPLTVLIDAHGKIVYYGSGTDNKLRSAVAGLGPEFESLREIPSATK